MQHFVFGTGAHASEIQELMKCTGLEPPIFLREEDEEAALKDSLKQSKFLYLGVGYPEARLRILKKWGQYQAEFKILTHKNAYIADSAVIEAGCVLQFGTVLSIESTLECGVLLNWNVTVGHHSVIGKGSVINPGASISGNCRIGSGVLIGTGARVLEGVTIASGAIIGAGAVVTKDLPKSATYVGIPARPIE